MLKSFLHNHALANLTFVLVLVAGIFAYGKLPREQDPNVNFNWVSVITVLPGASASDVEKRITDPLERAARRIRDVKFVSSHSRESVSSTVLRLSQFKGKRGHMSQRI
jgi:multidrug efflux pump subunit AcrB